MRAISLLQPPKIVFGVDSLKQFTLDFSNSGYKRALFIIARSAKKSLKEAFDTLREHKILVEVIEYSFREPTFSNYEEILKDARSFNADCVVGVGGGSVLDVAKLVAAMQLNNQKLEDVLGINNLTGRAVGLICLPTTSGTGAEVSPNSILLDESTQEKKGIISPFLVPDAAYIDPLLTLSLPPKITAETGIDALSHCIEAYTNKFSHPIVDEYALKGIELIARNLHKAYTDGGDVEARSAVALGSVYGGLCLGPVNTAAVHAISYPLGGKYHIPHGLANAILLPEVMEFNMSANVHKHAKIALAAGVEEEESELETARAGVEKIRELAYSCGIPKKLTALGVSKDSVDELTELAMKVTRLLKNNPREVSYEDARNIYIKLF